MGEESVDLGSARSTQRRASFDDGSTRPMKTLQRSSVMRAQDDMVDLRNSGKSILN